MPLVIGVPKEVFPGEKRVATVPEVVEKLIKLGFSVAVQSGAGDGSNCGDDAYRASGAEVVADAAALYSPMKIAHMIDPGVQGTKAGLEQHHLFPRGYLEELAITDIKQVNQIANFALVEWDDNIAISDEAPSKYWPEYVKRFSTDELEQMSRWHALPEEWQHMDYQAFLDARRPLIAGVIRAGYERLCGMAD